MFDISYTGLKKGTLTGEAAVICGSTSNVGKGYAQALAWAGAKVVIVGRSADKGNAVAEEINKDNGPDTAIFVQADVSKEEDIKNLYDRSIEKFGKVDILLNNAMDMSLNGPILGSDVKDLDRSYEISARAAMLAINAFVPDMIKRGHGTVSYSTTQAFFVPGALGGSIYCAGKAAATSVVMSLANEIKGTGVNVFCLCPAGVGMVHPNDKGVITDEMKAIKMPGFPGLIPIDAAGAALVYMVQNGEKMYGTGTMTGDILMEMNYPFPCPETVNRSPRHYIGGRDLNLIWCFMEHGF